MPAQDTSQIKEKIISILKRRGPSLPVHIAKETELSILFASAFLSELFSEKKIKISNMKVGNSPIYFIPGQESKLENFSQHLKSKEKEAFQLLKEKKFLNDKEQDPAIRVALRAIKDFAIPFKKNEEIFWRYFTIPEKDFNITQTVTSKTDEPENKETKNKNLEIFDKPEKKKKITKKKSSKTRTKRQSDKLFKKVKKFLYKENIEIIDFQSISKNELILKIKENEKEKFLIAYNKKRITDLDLIKTYKKLGKEKIPYVLLSLGNPSKKLSNLIEVIKGLDSIKKIEE